MYGASTEPRVSTGKTQASVELKPLVGTPPTASPATTVAATAGWLRIWDADLLFQQRLRMRKVTSQDNLPAVLDTLPVQAPNTIRFYEWSHEAPPQQIDILAAHLGRYAHRSSTLFHTASPTHGGSHGEMHIRKPISILSQWLEDEHEHYLYDALVIDVQHNGREREAVENGASIGGYASKEHGHFRSTLQCCSIDNNRLIVMSSVDLLGYASWLPERAVDILPAMYLFSPPVMTGGFDVTFCDGSRRIFIKLLVARFFQVHFHLLQEEFFYLLEMVHLESHARYRVAYDILCGDLEKLHFQISHMIRDVEFVIDDLTKTQRLQKHTSVVDYMHWSQYQLTVAKENLSQALKSQQRYHNVFEREQSQSEAQSLKRLTILAAIFLPLSLSSSILSISSRFASLGDKLFDFVGVSFLIGSVTVALYLSIKVFYKISRKYHALQKDYAADGNPVKRMIAATDRVLAKIIPLAALVAMTASFCVGMFIPNHQGDWRVGVIFASTFGAVLLLVGVAALIRRVYRVKTPDTIGIHQAKCPQCFPT